jgi:hypothetical protein
MRLRTVAAAACVAALAACAHDDVGSTHADPWTAFERPTPTPVRTLAPRLLAAGTYETSTAPRRLTFDLPADAVWTGAGEAADGFTLRLGTATMRVVELPAGATTVSKILDTLRRTPGLTKSADEVTRPVDGNDAWHLTWRVSKSVRVVVGGAPLAFRTGELDHAIVVAGPTAPLLVLMAAPDRWSFDTVYEEGHKVVFTMRIGR